LNCHKAVAALILTMCVTVAAAQDWPSKPVKVFLPGPAGSAPDIVMRLLGEQLSRRWGQQIIVDNRIGAAGNVGTAAAASAPADGYSLLFGLSAALAINEYTFRSLPFSPEKDFVPVVSLGISPMMVAVNDHITAQSLAELISLARANPGKLNFATSSSKNVAHLTGATIAAKAGISLIHVPYRTNAQAAAETISGLTQIYIDGIPAVISHMKAGRLRVLAVSSPKRLSNFPEIPAISETIPGFAFVGWFALMAPRGTPSPIIEKLNRDVNDVLKMPEVSSRLLELGIYDAGGTPEELAAFIRNQRRSFAAAVKAANIHPE